MDHACFGYDDALLRITVLAEADHFLGAANDVCIIAHRFHALWVSDDECIWKFKLEAFDGLLGEQYAITNHQPFDSIVQADVLDFLN